MAYEHSYDGWYDGPSIERYPGKVSVKALSTRSAQIAREKAAEPSSSGRDFQIVAARRPIATHDSVRLKTLRTEALADLDPKSYIAIPRLGNSAITPSESRYVFLRQYLNGGGRRSAKRFSHGVKRNINECNVANPMIFARLGNIGIFGAEEDQDDDRMRFIGPTLIGERPAELVEERQSFLRKLILPGDDRLFNELSDISLPHISLAMTNSQACAEKIAEAFREAPISGIWVSLRLM